MVAWRPWLVVMVGLGVTMMPWLLHATANRGLVAVDVESGVLVAIYAVWIAHGHLTERLAISRQANAYTGRSTPPE